MKFKRFLFLLTDEIEVKEFIKFSKLLDKKYGKDIEKDVVYIKDITKLDVFPLTIQGLGINSNTSLIIEENLKLENEKYEVYKEKLEKYFRKIYTLEGEIVDIALEELKAYDLLVVCKSKGEKISENLNSLLKYHYKPMIILSETDKEYSFENILMLNDGGYTVNASVYAYFNTFGISDIDVLRVNVEDDNRLTERFGSKCNIIDKEGDVVSIILSMVPDYDLLLMGDLRHSLLFERLTGQVGVKILEKTKTPIFMG